MRKDKCSKCGNLISACNLSKHEKSCRGVYKPFAKLDKCKHCGISLLELSNSAKGNHVLWCDENPNIISQKQDFSKRKIDWTGKKASSEMVVAISNGVRKAWADGKYKDAVRPIHGTPHTEESKQKIRIKALASNHRRLQRFTRLYVTKSGKEILLDSSWEEALAKRLDELNIEWERPKPFPWYDSKGIRHNYFADFYLPLYDLYLDPKNPGAMLNQKEKVSWLKQNISNLIFLNSLRECVEFTV